MDAIVGIQVRGEATHACSLRPGFHEICYSPPMASNAISKLLKCIVGILEAASPAERIVNLGAGGLAFDTCRTSACQHRAVTSRAIQRTGTLSNRSQPGTSLITALKEFFETQDVCKDSPSKIAQPSLCSKSGLELPRSVKSQPARVPSWELVGQKTGDAHMASTWLAPCILHGTAEDRLSVLLPVSTIARRGAGAAWQHGDARQRRYLCIKKVEEGVGARLAEADF